VRRKNFLIAAYKFLFYNTVIYINICFRIIFDTRIGFEIMEGYIIIFEFAIIDIVEIWPKIILPGLPELI
jgi:hypothetical protein